MVLFLQGHHVYKLFQDANKSGCSVTNHLLVLNLAAADFIMAIYLIVLGINAEIYSGKYVKYDLSWRSSKTCNALGILNVVSSETSMFTMVLLVSTRLYAVFKVLILLFNS